MKHSFLLSLALCCSWLFCPESLVIVGNSAGQMGSWSLAALAIAAFIFTACANLLANQRLPDSPDRAVLLLRPVVGSMGAATLTLAACLPLVVLAGTALLVSAGYTFNEVFLYWFPNFGFAFLLLGLITILQFFKDRVILSVQVCLVGLTATGLLVLSLYGMMNPPKILIDTTTAGQTTGFSSLSASLLLLLFVGSILPYSGERSSPPLFVPLLAPMLALFIFCFWIIASLNFVTPERLASSTIPYMTAARKIMGDPGRWIMGVVVICGSCGAVNGLMLLSRQMLASLADQALAPAVLSGKIQKWIIPPVIALLIGGMMATGLAGDELLEVLLRGALILWLVYFVVLCFSAIMWLKKEKQGGLLPAMVATLLLVVGLGMIIGIHPHKGELTASIFLGLGVSGVLTSCWLIINKFLKHKEC